MKFSIIMTSTICSTLFISTKAVKPDLYFGGMDNQGYLDWLSGVSYNKSTFIATDTDPNLGVAVHWTIVSDDSTAAASIQMAVVAPATGWSAFGLAESGSMRGADIVMYAAATKTLTDTYVLDQLVMPTTDACPSSWELVDSLTVDGFIIFEARRLLDTGDTQDRVIIDDSSPLVATTRVIAAWGNSDTPSFHGNNAARGAIRFFGAPETIDYQAYFTQSMADESEGNFTVAAQNYIIPSSVGTTYKLFCFSREELVDFGVPMDQDLHTIGFEPIVTVNNKKYVHHYVLYGSPLPWNKSLTCTDTSYPKIETAYGWAPGAFPQLLPPNVGGPLGSEGGFQSYALEIHYDNVDLDVNISDSSGVRIYYTSVKREFDSGSFSTGDPEVQLFGMPVTSTGGLTQHTFTCEEECLSTYLTEPVTVIQENLHMHKTAVSMVNQHIRNGEVIRQGQVDFWDFQQQGDIILVQPSYQILPGDSFRTICNYNSKNQVLWGPASDDEMCMATITYYPRKLSTYGVPVTCGLGIGEFLPGCEATYNVTPDLTTFEQLERIFGSVPTSCPTTNTGSRSPESPPVAAPSGSTSVAVSTVSNIYLNTIVGTILWTLIGFIN